MNRSKAKQSGSSSIMKIVVISLAAILIGVGAVNVIAYVQSNKSAAVINEDELWQTAFEKWENKEIIINFDSLYITSEKILELTEIGMEAVKVGNVEIATDIASAEANGPESYYDTVSELSSEEQEYDKEEYLEAGQIYFNSLVMTKYIAPTNKMGAVFSFEDAEGNKIAFGGKTIGNLVGILPTGINNFEDAGDYLNNEEYSESEYLKVVAHIIEVIMRGGLDKDSQEWISIAPKFFTLDGKRTIERAQESIGIGSGAKAVYMAIGATSQSMEHGNRALIVIKDGDESSGTDKYTYVILKLNSGYKIFDIDVV